MTAELQYCQPAIENPRQPKLRVPEGATDCHVHVYGPDSIYPPAPSRGFNSPDALPKTLRHVLDVMNIDRVVLVQPSLYGTDNRRHLDAAQELGRPARVVVSLELGVSDHELDRLHELGVRGVRYNIGHQSPEAIAEMPELAKKIARLGWHIQLFVMSDGGRAPLADMETMLAGLACDLVVDHIGSLKPAAGTAQPGFQALLRLVAAGRCWVKLTCGYRFSSQPLPYLDMLPMVRELMALRPDRMVWGSDWPHLGFKGGMPDNTDLLDLMTVWMPDESHLKKVLVDNPAQLYGF